MRILIVNGYSMNERGKQSFDRYCELVRRVFLNQRELLDTETEFFTRDVSNLDDFLFDSESGQTNAESARQFDFLDFIFLEIDATLRPWSKFAQKIMVLIRMALRTNKIVFASATAMQALVFFVATNLENPVEVINGPQGSTLGDMTKLQKTVDQITHNEYFLDNVTGDLYGVHFDQTTLLNTWRPIANCGMHQRKAAEEFNTLGKYMLKAPIYKPKGMKESYGIFVSSQDEEICSIRKNQMHNFLLKDVKPQFLVHSKHSWDIHPFNVLNPKKIFQILADSDRGPQIIQVNQNIVGVQFSLSLKYPESVQILRNFIYQKLVDIRSDDHKAISVVLANNELRKNKLDLEHLTQQQTDSQSKGEKSNINFEVLTKFRHVGFSGKRANKLEIVKNNAINNNLEQAIRTMRQTSSPRVITKTEEAAAQRTGLARMITKQHEQEKERFSKTGAEIRQMLHPNISDEGIPPNEPLWVPGNLQVSNQKAQNQSQTLIHSQSQIPRPQTGVSRTFKLTRVSTAKSRIQMVPDYDECRIKPYVRCSSPYLTPAQREMIEQKYSDLKILGSKTIRTSVVSTAKEIPAHHLFENPYQSKGDFKFREVDHNKWVGDQNFKLS